MLMHDRPLLGAFSLVSLPAALFALAVAAAPPPALADATGPLDDRWVDLLVQNTPPRPPPDRTHWPDPLRHRRVRITACPTRPSEPVTQAARPLLAEINPWSTLQGNRPVVVGGLRLAQVAQVFDEAAPRLQRCDTAENPAYGELVLRVNVVEGGVTEARVHTDTVGRPDLTRCVLAEVSRLRFPTAGAGITLLRYPLAFGDLGRRSP